MSNGLKTIFYSDNVKRVNILLDSCDSDDLSWVINYWIARLYLKIY